MITNRFEEKVAEMLLNYCSWKLPSREDLDTFLSSRGFAPYTDLTTYKILEICEHMLMAEEGKIEYKGYTIQKEDDPWALKYNRNYRFFRDAEKIWHAESIKEAKEEIDERVADELFITEEAVQEWIKDTTWVTYAWDRRYEKKFQIAVGVLRFCVMHGRNSVYDGEDLLEAIKQYNSIQNQINNEHDRENPR